MTRQAVAERFWAKVSTQAPSECWEWLGAVNPSGYGSFAGIGRTISAHRQAWELEHGPISEGMTVDHTCFNIRCVNTAHLRLLTASENARNQRSARKTHCSRGHEYTTENTYLRPAGVSGRRDCRTCIRERVARYQAKGRAA